MYLLIVEGMQNYVILAMRGKFNLVKFCMKCAVVMNIYLRSSFERKVITKRMIFTVWDYFFMNYLRRKTHIKESPLKLLI